MTWLPVTWVLPSLSILTAAAWFANVSTASVDANMMSLTLAAADDLLVLRRFLDLALRRKVLLLLRCRERRSRGERSLATLVRGTDTDLPRLGSARSSATTGAGAFFSCSSDWADDGVVTLGE